MKRTKKKKHIFLYILTILLYIIFILIIVFSYYIYKNSPDFDYTKLYEIESSNIYDSNNELITTIGSEKRSIIKYEDLSQVLIDAIIATEDSRFYEHKGVDIYRFLKATIGHIKGTDAGGASTLEMQLSKNYYTSTESKGIKGIIRKFTDIYISVFKIDEKYTKNEILEFYVNSPYLGSSSYGVEMASLTYFGKNAKDLNLVEASVIAGLFQAPSEYDPNINPDKCNERKNIVLELMYRHGYINKDELESAKEVKVEDIIIENPNVSVYQGYIDTVVEEVIEKTGNNPYDVSMDIYTNMNRDNQDLINQFYNEFDFRDEYVQVGIGVIDNNTGAIVAVGAGRNKNSEMTLNYATQIKRHPGSTAKPIFDYGPGIEYNNWNSLTTFNDQPIKYTYGGYMNNIDGKYLGTLTLEQCLIKSRNTCALQAFKRVKNSKINEFATSLGITPEYIYSDSNYINEAHSIGAFNGVSPIELAAAYQAFGNGGTYNEPHSVNKIVYKNKYGNIEENIKYESNKVMSEETAYIISYILNKATNAKTKMKDTEIATKTGTSSYDESILKSLNIPKTAVQDSWTVTFTKNYSIAIWYGYDELSKDHYLTNNKSFTDRVNIQSYIVKNIVNSGEKFDRPNGIKKITKEINGVVYTGIAKK